MYDGQKVVAKKKLLLAENANSQHMIFLTRNYL